MNLIFLYGPPAVGKLTIAKCLQNKLGYKLLHNHMIINIFEDIFDYDHPARNRLVREFRLRIIEEAVKDDLDIIITAGMAGSKTLFEYYTKIIETVEKNNGHIFLVHLVADEKVLIERVDDDFRKMYGKNFGQKEMREMLNKYSNIFDKYPLRDHLEIDTSHKSAVAAADEIINFYKLKPLDTKKV